MPTASWRTSPPRFRSFSPRRPQCATSAWRLHRVPAQVITRWGGFSHCKRQAPTKVFRVLWCRFCLLCLIFIFIVYCVFYVVVFCFRFLHNVLYRLRYCPSLNMFFMLTLCGCFMPLCTTLCRRGAPPRDPFYFIIFQSVLCHICLYHFILLFMLPSFCLLSSLSCSLSSCLFLCLYRFIPLYTNPHDSSFLFFCVCVLVHHAQSLA